MEKLDFKKTLKHLYAPTTREFELVEVPELQFAMADGEGDPNTSVPYREAVSWLYSVTYAAKFAAKAELSRDFAVMPLEGLWWAEDIGAFAADRRDEWRWRMLLLVPDFITPALFQAAVAKSSKKLGKPPSTLRLERYEEGLSVQVLHVGSYADEAPTIRRLHEEFLPANGFVESGPHHEIYLSDPRRTEAAKLRTIIRQPVRRL